MAEALRACVLAAGKGKRMGGQKPKVLFEAAGKTLLEWCLSALSAAGIHDLVVVVGFKKDEVVARLPTGVRWVEQSPQLGTGHAVLCARSVFPDDGVPLLVTCGDMPLLRPETFREVARQQRIMDAACVVLTTKIDANSRFGRVVRDNSGGIARIVEYQDATAGERAIEEGNTGVMCFRSQTLWPTLAELNNDNAAGEYYLTDAVAALLRRGARVCAHCGAEPEEALGVNTPADLQQVEAALRRRRGV